MFIEWIEATDGLLMLEDYQYFPKKQLTKVVNLCYTLKKLKYGMAMKIVGKKLIPEMLLQTIPKFSLVT